MVKRLLSDRHFKFYRARSGKFDFRAAMDLRPKYGGSAEWVCLSSYAGTGGKIQPTKNDINIYYCLFENYSFIPQFFQNRSIFLDIGAYRPGVSIFPQG